MYKTVNQSNAYHELLPVVGTIHRNLTVADTAQGLAAFDEKTRYVLVTVNTEGVRATFDGEAPTATDGHLLAAGAERLLSVEMAAAMKMIRLANNANVAVTELTR